MDNNSNNHTTINKSKSINNSNYDNISNNNISNKSNYIDDAIFTNNNSNNKYLINDEILIIANKLNISNKIFYYKFKKKKTNKNHSIFFKTNIRHFELNFKDYIFGYKNKCNDSEYKFSALLQDITFVKNYTSDKNKDIGKFGIEIFIENMQKHMLLFTDSKENHLNFINYCDYILLNKCCPLHANIFDFAIDFGKFVLNEGNERNNLPSKNNLLSVVKGKIDV